MDQGPSAHSAGPAPIVAKAKRPAPPKRLDWSDDDDSDEDAPLAVRKQRLAAAAKDAAHQVKAETVAKEKPGVKAEPNSKPVAKASAPSAKADPKGKASAPKASASTASASTASASKASASKASKPVSASKPASRKASSSLKAEPPSPARPSKRPRTPTPGGSSGEGDAPAAAAAIRWTTLEHAGVLFPPEYVPHGVKMLYDGKPVALTPEQEEVATFYAVMLKTDYMQKPQFRANFWEGFREVLGPKHVIQDLDRCDFTPIYEWHEAEREKKRAMTKEEKAAAKAEREDAEKRYKTALVDGVAETVGNFRVEPPGLFRGRGEHPKMGRIKRRIYPRDVIINVGAEAPVPAHPYPGQRWAEVRHDRTVTWLATWKDPINPKESKYVFLAANSSWKAESDRAKYEKARELAKRIGDIRAAYRADWRSKDARRRQMGVALYFIDALALRAGHEKDEDEADTVGCCTLKVENVSPRPPSSVTFDFLGKDSIRYENTIDVDKDVFHAIVEFTKRTGAGAAKKPGDQLFDTFDAQDLNQRLKELMDGLSVKVFRTYNASAVLDRLLAGSIGAWNQDHKGDQASAGGKKPGGKGRHDDAHPVKAEAVKVEAGGGHGHPPTTTTDVLPSPPGDDPEDKSAHLTMAEWDATDPSLTLDARKAIYDRANKEVAVLCNHQRAVPKAHEGQLERIRLRVDALEAELRELEEGVAIASGKAGKKKGAAKKDPAAADTPPGFAEVNGRKASLEQLEKRAEKKREQIEKLKLSSQVKEDLKTVALGTSKINYLDPRITVAWCKRCEVPLEKVFNKSLLQKFAWAMEVEPEYRF